jgi:cell division protein FtsI (penicillin-binding protein 3)
VAKRTRLLGAATVVLFGAVGAQLVHLSLGSHGPWRALANQETQVRVSLPASRGSILARNGAAFATSVARDCIVADPFQIHDPAPEALRLAQLLDEPVGPIEAALALHGGYSVVDSAAPLAVGSRIEQLALDGVLPGITVQPTQIAEYPLGGLAEPVVGRVGPAGTGTFGLEYQYQRLLAGQPGWVDERVTAQGVPVPGGVIAEQPAHAGTSIELTIDPVLQADVESALAKEIEQTRAIGGTAIVMDPHDGQILAMASLAAPPLPGTRPVPGGGQPVDVPRALPTESWLNDAVAYAYEPGSVAKIATFAAALEEHLITPSSTEVVPNQLVIDGSVFHDAESHPTEVLSMAQILARSSNVGTIELAERLGPQRLVESFHALGWGEPTGLAFPGAAAGYIKPASQWSPTAIGSTPIGQDQLVTPLEILDSYNAVANGGVLVTPQLVAGTVGSSGRLVPAPAPRARRVMPAWVASQLLGLLSHVTGPQATAPAAAIPGYAVAGKTGTSHKPYPDAGGYQPGAYWGTFVGLVPAPHPVLSAIVMLDQPVPIYGGMTAAPVFAQIMRAAIARYGITPDGQVRSGLLTSLDRAPGQGVTP